MNIFDLNIELFDTADAEKILYNNFIERLPGIPPFLSKKDCAYILGVSMKIINQLVASGSLPVTDIPDDTPQPSDLFGGTIELSRECCILRSDLVKYMEKALLCNKPVLEPEPDR